MFEADGGKGPIAKFIPAEVQGKIAAAAGAKPGDAVFFAAGREEEAAKLAGAARTLIALSGSPPADVVAQYRRELRPDEHLIVVPMQPREGTWHENRFPLDPVPHFHIADLSSRFIWSPVM